MSHAPEPTSSGTTDSGREPAEHELRDLLGSYHEPTTRHLSATQQRDLLARLPDLPPAQAAQQMRLQARLRRLRRTALLLGVALLVALGAWGVYADTDGVVNLFGGSGSTAGYLVLVLLLGIKPLAHLLAPSMPLLLLLGGLGGLWWLWQRLLRGAPPMLVAEPVRVDE